jgi:hypothetical protein
LYEKDMFILNPKAHLKLRCPGSIIVTSV